MLKGKMKYKSFKTKTTKVLTRAKRKAKRKMQSKSRRINRR